MVSLSGIRPETLDDCVDLRAELAALGVPLSLLVMPRHPGGSAVLSWIRYRAADGDAVLMHGYDHTSDPIGAWGERTVARLGRRAEFAGLPEHEARLRLHAAIQLAEAHRLTFDGFVPPRWLISHASLQALRRSGFRLCADATAVRELDSGTVTPGRVYGFGPMGGGQRVEPWWAKAMVLGAARSARRGGLVRLAVDGADLAHPSRRSALRDAVDLALHHGAVPSTYTATRRLEPAAA